MRQYGDAERAALIDVIAQVPDLAARLLQTHTPTPNGRCPACAPRQGLQPEWPCVIHDYASAAARRQLGRPNGPRPT
ncbi:MAG TPA: hypothetical protein VIL55_02810 [Naasia sp.]|jgi:hypothetical protein